MQNRAAEAGLKPLKQRPARRRWIKFGIIVLVVAAVLAPTGWLVDYRLTYNTFAWWKIPPVISYCGRDYKRGSTITTLPTRDYVFTQVMKVEPSGWPVYSMNPRNPGDIDMTIPGLPCTMGLVLKKSDNQFIQYGLLGGP